MPAIHRIQSEPLRHLIAAVFSGAGSHPNESNAIAENLVRANLVGHDSHGVIRTKPYILWHREGKVFANRRLEVLFESETMVHVDGQLGYGQTVGQQAVELGLAKCKGHGASIVALRNSGHLGRIGHWAEEAAEAGCVSLHFVNTSGLGMYMVPFGGIDPRISINPVTIGVPAKGRAPIIFDIAAAATAEGKLNVARNKGVPVPDGWILNSEGKPTNDPNEFYGPPRGSILPFGGYKGFGLGFMVEMLAGALTGSGCSRADKLQLEQGMLSVFVDPERLSGGDAFAEEVNRYVDFVKSSRPSQPDGEVLVPGDPEARCLERRLAAGIELDEKTWDQIVETARSVEVDEELIAIK